MFGISSTEFAVILVIALLAVGPKQMPEVLRVFGRVYRKLNRFIKKASQLIDDTLYDADRIADKAEKFLNGKNDVPVDKKEGENTDDK